MTDYEKYLTENYMDFYTDVDTDTDTGKEYNDYDIDADAEGEALAEYISEDFERHNIHLTDEEFKELSGCLAEFVSNVADRGYHNMIEEKKYD